MQQIGASITTMTIESGGDAEGVFGLPLFLALVCFMARVS